MTQIKKPITWGDLKKFANELPDERLNDEVIWWGEERGGAVYSVEPLEENYLNTDEGFAPKSSLEADDIEWNAGNEELEKGHPILWVEPETVEGVLGVQICYKTDKPCKYKCGSVCKESV